MQEFPNSEFHLKNQKSVHFENLRRVSDFGGLAGIESLRYIYINGTFDWIQPVDNFDFLSEIRLYECERQRRSKTRD